MSPSKSTTWDTPSEQSCAWGAKWEELLWTSNKCYQHTKRQLLSWNFYKMVEILLLHSQCTCGMGMFIVYSTIWLTNTIAFTWEDLHGKPLYTRKYHKLLGKVPGNSARSIQNHVASSYCIPECMSKVQCHSHLSTFHTVYLLDFVAHTWTHLAMTHCLETEYRRHLS